MKNIGFAILGLLAVAAIAWGVLAQLDRSDSLAASPETKKPDAHAPDTTSTVGPGNLATRQPHGPVPSPTGERMETVWTPPASRQAPVQAAPHRVTSAPIQSKKNTTPGTTAATQAAMAAGVHSPVNTTSGGGIIASTAASSGGAAKTSSSAGSALSGAETSILELDPGVPVPAALLPSEGESDSPTVAAAQQQIADTFVQEVDNALSQPETPTSDIAVNDAYYDSLNAADEQYRALYGDAAYNQKTMQATMEALNAN